MPRVRKPYRSDRERANRPVGLAVSGRFRLDDLDAGLPQLVSAEAANIGRGQNDARRAHTGGLLVQPELALQAGLNGASDADGDHDEHMLVITDHDIELLAGDAALLDTDPEAAL